MHHLLGALIVTTAVISMAEVIRAGRYFNVLAGLAIAGTPFVLGYFGTAAGWNGIAAGLAVAALSLPRGTVRESYGAWDRVVR